MIYTSSRWRTAAERTAAELVEAGFAPWGHPLSRRTSYIVQFIFVNSLAINSACFNTVSVANCCMSGG